ncbi:MAG: hypothetical protein DMF69_10895 [Acidobacteria bacterium]|nr:MAG: hypothetical protein DMF69_10895 [Acidobacteriota bacterium]
MSADLMSGMLQLVGTRLRVSHECCSSQAINFVRRDKLKHIGHQIGNAFTDKLPSYPLLFIYRWQLK